MTDKNKNENSLSWKLELLFSVDKRKNREKTNELADDL